MTCYVRWPASFRNFWRTPSRSWSERYSLHGNWSLQCDHLGGPAPLRPRTYRLFYCGSASDVSFAFAADHRGHLPACEQNSSVAQYSVMTDPCLISQPDHHLYRQVPCFLPRQRRICFVQIHPSLCAHVYGQQMHDPHYGTRHHLVPISVSCCAAIMRTNHGAQLVIQLCCLP